MQNNPINGNSGINDVNIPSNIQASEDDKKVSKDSAEDVLNTEYQSKDFEKFNIDKVDELEESKDPSEKEN